jgi:hypothetical protein
MRVRVGADKYRHYVCRNPECGVAQLLLTLGREYVLNKDVGAAVAMVYLFWAQVLCGRRPPWPRFEGTTRPSSAPRQLIKIPRPVATPVQL